MLSKGTSPTLLNQTVERVQLSKSNAPLIFHPYLKACYERGDVDSELANGTEYLE